MELEDLASIHTSVGGPLGSKNANRLLTDKLIGV